MRGYPVEEDNGDSKGSADVIYVRLAKGAHVSFYGSRYDRMRIGEQVLRRLARAHSSRGVPHLSACAAFLAAK